MEKFRIEIFRVNPDSKLDLPFADEGVRAGFPSPAQDYMELSIDLNRELIHDPASTFFARVRGNSMTGEAEDGDILIINKAGDVVNGKMAVCYIDGEFTLKYINIQKDAVWLVPANKEYPSIKVTGENDMMVWGIVEYIIKKPKLKKDFNEL